MNIHEYQAKGVLKKVRRAGAARRSRHVGRRGGEGAHELGGPVWVVKAQIHAGGRGKAGGVKVVKSIDDVKKEATRILGSTLGHASDRPEGQAGQPPLHRGRLGDRQGVLPVDAARPRDLAGRHRGLDRRRHGYRESRARHAGEDHHHPGRSGRQYLPAPCARGVEGAQARRRSAKADEPAADQSLQGLRRRGHEPARDQSAGRHQGQAS